MTTTEQVVDLEAEEFLEIVWGERHGWIDMPAKVGAYWVPWHHEWIGEAEPIISRRIDACLRDGESLYFSVGQFERRGRNADDLMVTHWLWADLDEVHPTEASKEDILPTIAWESSPGRFQALWRLQRPVHAETHGKLNQALSYFLGADHGGWDATQVLRLPGTRNFKYESGPAVRLLWYHEDLEYSAKYIWSKVHGSLPVGPGTTSSGLPNARPMPARVRALLRVPPDAVVEGERSSKLWQIECSLAEAGWGEDAIYGVVVDSSWNKWSNVGTGERRLRGEIRKAIHHVARKRAVVDHDRRGETEATHGDAHSTPRVLGEEPAPSDEEVQMPSLPFIRYASFMAMQMEEPKWLIKDIWTAQSHGIFGGEPKTSKTTLSLALALSVASGRPFLGRYSVPTPGPVLFVQEENAPWMMQDRLRKLAHYYGLLKSSEVKEITPSRGSLGGHAVLLEFPTDVPLKMLNNWGFDLTDEDHREALRYEVSVVRPALVVLDPLYLLLPGVDTDKTRDLTPYLKWLLMLRNEFECAVMVNHHFRKSPVGSGAGERVRSGQRLMGSGIFHGWVDSALYSEQIDMSQKPGWVGARLEREFRAFAPQQAINVEMRLGAVGALDMEAVIYTYDVQAEIELMVQTEPGISVNQIAEALGLDRKIVLGRCRDSETIRIETKTAGRGKSHQCHPQSAGTGSDDGSSDTTGDPD